MSSRKKKGCRLLMWNWFQATVSCRDHACTPMIPRSMVYTMPQYSWELEFRHWCIFPKHDSSQNITNSSSKLISTIRRADISSTRWFIRDICWNFGLHMYTPIRLLHHEKLKDKTSWVEIFWERWTSVHRNSVLLSRMIAMKKWHVWKTW